MPNELNTIDTAADEECYTYEGDTAQGEWQTCGGGGSVSDAAYGVAWDGDTTVAPSKNSVYDKIETIASGGDNITVNTTGATNANFLDNLYIDWAIDTAATPDDITSKFNYAETLAGNPAFLTTECVFTADGLLCEGTTADTIEIKLAFPDPATTDKTITLPNATDTLVGRDTTDTLTNKTLAAANNVIDADTAVALAANGTNCSAGSAPLGVDASGAVESCTDYEEDLSNSAGLLAALSDETGTGVAVFGTSPTITLGENSTINNGAAPTVNAAGEIAVDTTSDQLIYYGVAAGVLTDDYTLCKTLESPVEADDNIPLWNFKRAVSITDVYCEVDGGTSISLTLSDGTNALEAITCDGDGAEDDGSIANGTFIARERIEMDLASPSGTNTWLVVCVTFETTAD